MKTRWLAVLFALLFVVPSLDATAGSRSGHGKSAHGKTSARAAASKHRATGGARAAGKGGRVIRDKRGRTVRRAPPPPPMVEGAGAATPTTSGPVTPKNVPSRAYAADGQSFYRNGEKIRVRGAPVVGPEGSELAKQRLQKALDGGEVTLEEKSVDENGNAVAIVRVNGRDVADLLLLDEIRSGNLP